MAPLSRGLTFETKIIECATSLGALLHCSNLVDNATTFIAKATTSYVGYSISSTSIIFTCQVNDVETISLGHCNMFSQNRCSQLVYTCAA